MEQPNGTQPTDERESQLTFEEAAAQLEELVARMEEGKQPLEALIADFERGTRLLARCRGQLERMRRQLEILERETAEGGEWKAFSPEEAAPSRQGELPL